MPKALLEERDGRIVVKTRQPAPRPIEIAVEAKEEAFEEDAAREPEETGVFLKEPGRLL